MEGGVSSPPGNFLVVVLDSTEKLHWTTARSYSGKHLNIFLYNLWSWFKAGMWVFHNTAKRLPYDSLYRLFIKAELFSCFYAIDFEISFKNESTKPQFWCQIHPWEIMHFFQSKAFACVVSKCQLIFILHVILSQNIIYMVHNDLTG